MGSLTFFPALRGLLYLKFISASSEETFLPALRGLLYPSGYGGKELYLSSPHCGGYSSPIFNSFVSDQLRSSPHCGGYSSTTFQRHFSIYFLPRITRVTRKDDDYQSYILLILSRIAGVTLDLALLGLFC